MPPCARSQARNHSHRFGRPVRRVFLERGSEETGLQQNLWVPNRSDRPDGLEPTATVACAGRPLYGIPTTPLAPRAMPSAPGSEGGSQVAARALRSMKTE